MNTEEAIQKMTATLDENRELKETIRELNTDRDWWKAAAHRTEKRRLHLYSKLVECRNMLNEKTATIDKLNKMYYDSLDELMRQDSDIDDIQDHRSELEREINSLHVDAKARTITIDNLYAIIDEQNAHIKEIQKERDDLKTEFENAPHGERFLLARVQSKNAELESTLADADKLFAERGATIEMLETNLADRERQFNELDDVLDQTRGLLRVATDCVWEQNNEITEIKAKLVDAEDKLADQMRRNSKISEQRDNETDNRRRVAKHLQHCIGERDAGIKELEGKLADSERQFNELDDALVRTFALLHVVNDCLRKRDKIIDELESELHR